MINFDGTRKPRLMVADDEQAILDLLRRRLEGLGCEVTVLEGGERVVATARELMPDLILLDVMMPDLDGFSACQYLKEDAAVRDIPVIMMTARSDLDSRIRGLEIGAQDFVAKPFETAELVARVKAALRVKGLQDELKEANKRLEQLAASDPLTGLPNRRTFDEQFFMTVERARRSGRPLSVLMMDIDHFKQVNDTYGHQTGDEALRLISGILSGRHRITDLVGRYGGEEFAWVMPGASGQAALEVAEWLRRTVEATPLETQEAQIRLTVSVGVSAYDPDEGVALTSSEILESADRALLDAKAGGRNRVSYRALGGPQGDLVGDGGTADQVDLAWGESAGEDEDEVDPGITRYR